MTYERIGIMMLRIMIRRQHMSAYVRMRQYTSADVSKLLNALLAM